MTKDERNVQYAKIVIALVMSGAAIYWMTRIVWLLAEINSKL